MPAPTPAAPAAPFASGQNHRGAFAVVTGLFFMWGFLTVMNDILIPHFKAIFDLNYAQAMFVQFTFFLAYFILSLPAGRLVNRIGYQNAMIAGLGTMGVGSLMFIGAAAGPSYPVFLVALFVLASGMTILQVSANPYVTALGPERTASSRLNLAQAVNSLGTAIAPWLGGYLILSVATKTAEELRGMAPEAASAFRVEAASSVKMPYLCFALMLFALAAVIWRCHLPALPSIDSAAGESTSHVWRIRHLMLGAAGIFLYCGAEVSIGSFLVNFLADPNIAGLAATDAARYVSFYWMGAMIGRFAGAALLQRVRSNTLLGIYGALASLLVWVCVFSSGSVAMWTVIAVGLLNSIMFPNIFSLAIEGLGSLTSYGSGILIMSILGAAVVPLVQGVIADQIGVHRAFFVPALCYLYVVYYGFHGYRRTPLAASSH